MLRAGFNGPASASQTAPSQAPARACPAPTRVRGSCCTAVVLADEWFRPSALAARTGVVSARHGHVAAGRAPHARHAPEVATTRQYAPPLMTMNGKLVEMPPPSCGPLLRSARCLRGWNSIEFGNHLFQPHRRRLPLARPKVRRQVLLRVPRDEDPATLA